MSSLQYYAYKGWGQKALEFGRMSQAVRVGNRIECSGQGGWNPETGVSPEDVNTQIDQAFASVDLCLRDAGGKGWSQVYRINTYHVDFNAEALAALKRNFIKWMPDHRPINTIIGVAKLAFDDMRVEIEVVAIDE